MSIVKTVLHRDKLRQERHGLEHRNYRTRRSLPARHAAPDGAWMASGGLGCYKHAGSYGVALPRSYSTGISEEPTVPIRLSHLGPGERQMARQNRPW
jgi:hypothetical protein